MRIKQKQFRTNIYNQLDSKSKASLSSKFKLKPDITFYNQRIRSILMPFLKHLLKNIELQNTIEIEDKNKYREVIFTNEDSLSKNTIVEEEDRFLVKISLNKYLNILTEQEQYEVSNLGVTNMSILSSYFSNYTLSIDQRRPLWLYLIGNRLKLNRNQFDRNLDIVVKSNKLDLENREQELIDSMPNLNCNTPNLKRKYLKPFVCDKVTSQIEKDLDRTFPSNIRTINESIKLYNEIKVLLQIFYVYRPDIGYVQGMNYLATTLMSIFPLYEAYVCFCNIILGCSKNRSLLYNVYTFQIKKISAYTQVFNKLLEHYSPEVYELLESNAISSQVYTLAWWYTLYSSSLPLEKVQAIWDIVLIFGDIAIIKIAVFLIVDLEGMMREGFRKEGFVDIRSLVEHADIGKVLKRVVESSDISGKISGKIGYALSGSMGERLGLKGNNIDFGDLNDWVLHEIMYQDRKNDQGNTLNLNDGLISID